MTTAQKTSYKNLIVYQKAKKLTVEIISFFSKYKLPKSFEFIVNQLYRSASSVGANIAEGYGRYYEGSLRQFFAIARGSAFESDYWLEILRDLNKFNNLSINRFSETNSELSKMLTVLMKKGSIRKS